MFFIKLGFKIVHILQMSFNNIRYIRLCLYTGHFKYLDIRYSFRYLSKEIIYFSCFIGFRAAVVNRNFSFFLGKQCPNFACNLYFYLKVKVLMLDYNHG